MANGQGPAPAQSGASKVGSSMDTNLKLTLQWVAIFYVASRVVEYIIGWIGIRFFAGGLVGRFARAYGGGFPIGGLVSDLVWAAIVGLIIGFIIYKYWSAFQGWNQKTFKFASVFKFFFVWDVIIAVLVGVLLSFSAFFIGALPVLFNVIGIIIGAFVFAKGFETKLGHLYRM